MTGLYSLALFALRGGRLLLLINMYWFIIDSLTAVFAKHSCRVMNSSPFACFPFALYCSSLLFGSCFLLYNLTDLVFFMFFLPFGSTDLGFSSFPFLLVLWLLLSTSTRLVFSVLSCFRFYGCCSPLLLFFF